MSWKTEVQVKGEGDKWHPNGLAFATREEAEAYGVNKVWTWTLATNWRAVESDQQVNYRWTDKGLKPCATSPSD